MKLLAVCSAGTVRSGALVLAAKRRGIRDALQAGIDFNSEETMTMLVDWADVVLVAEPQMIERLASPKCLDSGLGGDRWGNPLDGELASLCDAIVARL